MGTDVSMQVDRLLRQRDEDVVSMRHDEYMNAIRVLTLKATAAEYSNDAAMIAMSQKQLANATSRPKNVP